MCVILVSNKNRLTEGQIEDAYCRNSDGAGIAWREEVDGERMVKWEKGLDLEGIKSRALSLPLPYVTHFRISTAGGIHDDLCHPFPITGDCANDLVGTFGGQVLFHNGTWTEWKHKTMTLAQMKNVQIPGGYWSDSRALALLTHHYGEGWAALSDQKCVLFGPRSMKMFGLGWSYKEEMWMSNESWLTPLVHHSSYRRAEPLGIQDIHKKALPAKSSSSPIDPRLPKKYQDIPGIGAKKDNGYYSVDPTRISLSEARELLTDDLISHNQFKRIRKHIENYTSRALEDQVPGVGLVH